MFVLCEFGGVFICEYLLVLLWWFGWDICGLHVIVNLVKYVVCLFVWMCRLCLCVLACVLCLVSVFCVCHCQGACVVVECVFAWLVFLVAKVG